MVWWKILTFRCRLHDARLMCGSNEAGVFGVERGEDFVQGCLSMAADCRGLCDEGERYSTVKRHHSLERSGLRILFGYERGHVVCRPNVLTIARIS
jgi:hypothetical protein